MEANPLKNERVKKFLEKFFPTKVDKFGLPSLITINNVDHSLTCSIDRHSLRKAINSELIKNFSYGKEESTIIADFYCEEKYDTYKKILLSI